MRNLAWRSAVALAAVVLAYSLVSMAMGLAMLAAALVPTTAAAAGNIHPAAAMMKALPDPVVVFLLTFTFTGRAARL